MRPFLYCFVLALAAVSATPLLAQPDPGPVEPTVPVPSATGPTEVLLGGWFAAVETAIVQPRIEQYPSELLAGVPLAITVSPEFTGGYRFASGRAIHFDYRVLSSSGSKDYAPRAQPIGIGRNDEVLTTFRPYTGYADLDMHTFDLDITFRDPSWDLLPLVRSRWEIGARAVLLSSEVREPRVHDDRFGLMLTQASEWFGDEKLTSSFQGGGPHFDYKLALASDSLGLEVFALSDIAVLFGTGTARYSPVGRQPVRGGREVGPGWSIESGSAVLLDARPITERSFSSTAWNWKGDVGASLTRPWRGRLVRFTAGYRMDFWTFSGKSSGGSGFFGGSIKVPDLDLDIKGAFLRFEMHF